MYENLESKLVDMKEKLTWVYSDGQYAYRRIGPVDKESTDAAAIKGITNPLNHTLMTELFIAQCFYEEAGFAKLMRMERCFNNHNCGSAYL